MRDDDERTNSEKRVVKSGYLGKEGSNSTLKAQANHKIRSEGDFACSCR